MQIAHFGYIRLQYLKNSINGVLASFLLTITFTASSYGESLSLSAGEAVAYALEHNLELKALEQFVEARKSRAKYENRLPDPKIHVAYADDFTFKDNGESSIDLGLSQEFPLAGRLKHAKAVAVADLGLAELRVAEAKRQLIHDVTDAFIRVTEMEQKIAFIDEHLGLHLDWMESLKVSIQKGEMGEHEKRQLALDIALLNQRMTALKGSRVSLYHDLLAQMGLDAGTRLELRDAQKDAAVVEVKGYERSDLERRADYQMAERILERAQHEIRYAESKKWDTLTVGVRFQNEKSHDDPAGLGTDRFMGVELSMPLPLWNANRGSVREQLHMKAEALERVRELRIHIRNEIDAAIKIVQNSSQQVEHFKENVLALVHENYDFHQSAFDEGRLGLLELIHTHEQKLENELKYIELSYAYKRALNYFKFVKASHNYISNASSAE